MKSLHAILTGNQMSCEIYPYLAIYESYSQTLVVFREGLES